ncbi:hypothetical protein [Epibacterium ulvae]|uniref:hypothetical protein n=1 Tax=Epibacterium ulvae TaxID=1156985 RepID=UPI0024921EE9|nr:hypothetical protein [Epibacterium ulvae]
MVKSLGDFLTGQTPQSDYGRYPDRTPKLKTKLIDKPGRHAAIRTEGNAHARRNIENHIAQRGESKFKSKPKLVMSSRNFQVDIMDPSRTQHTIRNGLCLGDAVLFLKNYQRTLSLTQSVPSAFEAAALQAQISTFKIVETGEGQDRFKENEEGGKPNQFVKRSQTELKTTTLRAVGLNIDDKQSATKHKSADEIFNWDNEFEITTTSLLSIRYKHINDPRTIVGHAISVINDPNKGPFIYDSNFGVVGFADSDDIKTYVEQVVLHNRDLTSIERFDVS